MATDREGVAECEVAPRIAPADVAMAEGGLQVECPSCGKQTVYRSVCDNPYFPFCSERCKLLDLGKWLEEEHRIHEPGETDLEGRHEAENG